MPDPLDDAIAQSIDDEVRQRVRGLIHLVIDEAEAVMKRGAPGPKEALMKNFLQIIVREMKEEKKETAVDELKAQVDQLHADLRAQVQTQVPTIIPPPDQPPSDTRE